MHNIFNNRFYSLREIPWHRLGVVSDVEESAVSAFNRMTPYIVELCPLTTETDGGVKLALKEQAIVRWPTPDDPHFRSFGVVGPKYCLVDPLRTCEIWDESVNKPVETLGVLGVGERMFITTKLEPFDIRGDQVESYLLLDNPYTGSSAIEVRLTPVRVVCQNTLIAARSASTETFKIVHDAKVEERLRSWMRGIVLRAEGKLAAMRQVFDHMAREIVPQTDAEEILRQVYVPASPPKYVPDPALMLEREAAYEASVQWAQNSALRVLECWQGLGTGMGLPATDGTLWGLYNAVVEVEDYKPAKGTANVEKARAYGSLFGDRAELKARSYEACVRYLEAS